MSDLIKRLQEAPEGSRGLDNQVALAVGWVRLSPSQIKRRHGGWIHPSDTRKDGSFNYPTDLDSLHGTDIWRDPSPYTTSIDAALPGEDIRVVTMLCDGMWEAQAFDKNGNYQIGEANTEALARRIAALKAREKGLI